MGSKKLQVALPLLFAIVMIAGMAIGYKLKEETGGNGFFKTANRNNVQEVLDLVKSKYTDAIATDSLNGIGINAILEHLDPHSVYIPAADAAAANEDLSANFGGIGIEYQMVNDSITITRIIPGGPSEKAGLQIGDAIVTANDTVQLSGKKFKHNQLRKYLRGAAGSIVVLGIVHDNSIKKVTVTRGSISVNTVDGAYMIDSLTGYLHLNKFADRSYEEFMQNLEKLQSKGMKKLVLDLRGNGGGLLQQAVNIADEFLSDDKLIVYTEGNKSPKTEYRCRKEGSFENNKLVVLIDELSASASEVLCGALQDWDRATIIGRRSFGKGLVQQTFHLSDGSEVRLTVAKYFTPLGRNIQKPYGKNKVNYEMEIMNRYHDGEMNKPDTAVSKSPAFKTPAGHIVYGGGGITPDVFVALDTNMHPSVFFKPLFRNAYNSFVMQWYRTNKNYLAKTNLKDFNKQYVFSDSDWQLFKKIAAKDGFNISENFKPALIFEFKSMIAELAWGMNGYYEVRNQNDNTVAKALAVLK